MESAVEPPVPPTGEDGEYNPNTGVITIYSHAFTVSADRPGGF
jgi:hypothetical protein